MQMNVNETVWVKLTPAGEETYQEALEKDRQMLADLPSIQVGPKKRSPRGFICFQMWELMNLFGPKLEDVAAIPFEDNQIHFNCPG